MASTAYKSVGIACLLQLLCSTGANSAGLPGPPPSPLRPLSPYTAVIAGDFAAGCQIDRSSCAAMIGEVLMNRIQFDPTSHICLPDVNYAEGVAAWIVAHPEIAHMSTEDGVYRAITTLYRCGAPNNY
jgi:hypothetical protein